MNDAESVSHMVYDLQLNNAIPGLADTMKRISPRAYEAAFDKWLRETIEKVTREVEYDISARTDHYCPTSSAYGPEPEPLGTLDGKASCGSGVLADRETLRHQRPE